MTAEQHVYSSRPYHWGAIYISDAECQQEFDIDFDGDGPVHATAAHIGVEVVHPGSAAEDDTDVALDVRVETERVAGVPYEVTLDVPSGQLSIGDADEEVEVKLRPGRWLLQFDLDSPDAARRVEVILSPL